MKKIKLTRNYRAMVDDSDYEMLNNFNWYASNNKGFVVAVTAEGIQMHNAIMNPPANKVVIHEDTNKLNNQRSNIVLVSTEITERFVKKEKRYLSEYKGVSKHEDKYKAYAVINGKYRHLGVFQDEKEAALAYNEAAIEYFGTHAMLNSIEQC